MKKLRNVMIGALLSVLPVLALEASTLTTDATPAGLSSTQSLTGTCWIYMGGRWWIVPC